MDDRTAVTLIVLAEQADEARAILLEENGAPEEEDPQYDPLFHSFSFCEVNYGNLQGLEELGAAGIAYNSYWERGSNYGPGTCYGRFTEDGEHTTFEVYDDQESPAMDALLERIDDPARLRAFILQWKEDHTPLPWDHQIEYGKRYRAKQLISS